MTLQLDDRQRAMLLEMGVRVWLPGAAFAVAPQGGGDTAALDPVPVASPTARAASPTAPASAPLPAAGAAAPLAPAWVHAPGLQALQSLDWQALAQTAAQCQACGLCAGRTHSTLDAARATAARWMVVGDPPDDQEDSAGQAFVGDSGALLDNMLKAVGAVRSFGGALPQGTDAAYATNVSKCRVPAGRVPQAAELAQCSAYLQREIALVRPQVIVAMGRFANQVLLAESPQAATLPLGRQRGTVYHYRGIPVVVTYAPQALIRNPADKAKAWADLCLAMDVLAQTN
ncbi:MAG: uracil-DNA glycosylase [Betaproteobacteria bacterium]